MVMVFILCLSVSVGVACWFGQKWAVVAYARYRSAFQKEASERLSEFFVFLDPAQLWVANLTLCGAAALIAYAASSQIWLAGAAGAIALVAPQFSIRRLRRRRLSAFDAQLPDLLLALSGALRAGAGVQAGLRLIVQQSPAPLAQEFGLMLRQQRMGVPFEQALANLYRRMPTEAAGLVISSLNIASQTGGNLAETLDRIAATLRARLHLLGRIHALTSQGRLQAWIMACLPMILAAILHYIDPDSMRALWGTPAGWLVLGVIATLETAGIVAIRRIVNIQV
ncbi:pilus assembly protein [Parapusillimonas sp. SGNA-6]|nr:pilus assembly protein [Parapusillimonas sp. SGNA-6]